MPTFPTNFSVSLPVIYLGQKIDDDEVRLTFAVKGFDAVGLEDPTVTLSFDKNVYRKVTPNALVMHVRRNIVTAIGRGLHLAPIQEVEEDEEDEESD